MYILAYGIWSPSGKKYSYSVTKVCNQLLFVLTHNVFVTFHNAVTSM